MSAPRSSASEIEPWAPFAFTQSSSTGLRAEAMKPPVRTEMSRSTSSTVFRLPRLTDRKCPCRARLPPLTTWIDS